MNRLVLVDGNAILHRAYHALPPLTAPDGTLVNAVYGFTSMLLKIVHDLAPTHLAVAFDRPKPTFRKEIFKGYQAKRPKMDEELVGQIEIVHDVIGAMGISIFEMDGFEADDILATLSQEALGPKSKILNKSKIQNPNHQKIEQVIIVTGDRDILQLVQDDQVLVYMPTKGLSEAKLYGEKEVKERLGVAPKQVVDYKALAGDSADNYSGVAGIGPKTAQELLKTFGSVKNLYSALEGKKKTAKGLAQTQIDRLIAGKDDALLSRELATIKTDVPLGADIDNTKLDDLNTPKAREELTKLGFNSLLKRIAGEVPKKQGRQHKEKHKEEQAGEQQQLL